MKPTKIKLILFDFNGVAARGDHTSTSKHFGGIHGTPWKKVYAILYTKYFNLLVQHKISEAQAWQLPIKELGWKQDWRKMRQWHLDQQRLHPPEMEMVRRLRLSGYQCVLLSKNIDTWFAYLEQRLKFRMHFDFCINAREIGLPKASRETMQYICRRFGVKPSEILFLEDQAQNLVAARKMGVHCIYYKNYRPGSQLVDRYLGRSWRSPKHEWWELSQRQRMSPLPNIFSTQAVTTITAKIAGHHFNVLSILQRRMLWWLVDHEDHYIAAQGILRQIIDHPSFFMGQIEQVRQHGQALIAFTKKVHRMRLSAMLGAAVARLYDRFADLYKEMYGVYFVILAVEKQLNQYLKGLLFLKVRDAQELQHRFGDLTVDTRAMYPKQEERELCELALGVTKNSKLKQTFRLPAEEVLAGLRRFPAFSARFRAHCRKFFWITRDYEDPAWEPIDFVRRLQDIVQNGTAQSQMAHIDAFHQVARRKRLAAERRLKLSAFEKAMFGAMRDGILLKEFRKRYVSLSLFYMDTLVNEYSRRLALPVPHVRHFLQGEPYLALVKKKDFSVILHDRYELGAFETRHGRVVVTTGTRAKKLLQQVLHIPKTWSVLHGIPVSGGKSSGPARLVINLDDLAKVQPGDIIVTVQAVPSFSTAIKISAGLVADGGTGVTSHPATLAREAGIPCVTGLRFASQVIKDGDRIEVDGYHGTVKKV